MTVKLFDTEIKQIKKYGIGLGSNGQAIFGGDYVKDSNDSYYIVVWNAIEREFELDNLRTSIRKPITDTSLYRVVKAGEKIL